MPDNPIIESIDHPEKIEALYHAQKSEFETWLKQAFEKMPDSETLKVWNARIHYSPERSNGLDIYGIGLVIVLSVISCIIVKLPSFSSVSFEFFFPRFVPMILVASLMVYFAVSRYTSRWQMIIVGAGVVLSAILMLNLPDDRSSATIIMSQIHLPLLLLSFLAIIFMAENWRKPEYRLRYIRYLGEILIYGTIILLGGMVLTGLTIGMFGLIGLSIADWYGEYIVVLGLVAAPIVATYLYDRVLGQSSNIASAIANTFSPLFLVTVVCYLIAMAFAQKSPFEDRDFLIIFNGLLLLVWGMTVFSVAGKNEKQESKIVSVINISLISSTLIINTTALSAIIFRSIEYGVTPNRVVVTGSNLLIFLHLIFILAAYFRGIKQQKPKLLPNAIAGFLPVYTSWSVFVVAILPFIFSFK